MTRPNATLLVVVWAVFCAGIARVAPASAGTADLYRRGHVELEELFVIGGEDAPEEEMPFRMSLPGFDADGNILFSDSKLHTIFKFDSSGGFLGTMCSEGGGPGDLRMPTSLVVEPGGNIVVFEMGNHRIQRLDMAGEYIAAANYPDWLSEFKVGPSGQLYAKILLPPDGVTKPEADFRIARFGDDLVELVVIEEATILLHAIAGTLDRYTVTTVPYRAVLEWAPLPGDRIVSGRSDENRLRIRSSSGEVLKTIELEGDPPPVTGADRDEYFGRWIRDGEDKLDPELRKAIEFPKHKPYFGRITLDGEYNMLIRWGNANDGEAVFLVYTHEGEFVSRVTMDKLPDAVKIRGDRLYAIDRSFDVLPTITCYRMK